MLREIQPRLTKAQVNALRVAADYYANAFPLPKTFTKDLRDASKSLDVSLHVQHMAFASKSLRRWLQTTAA